VKYSAGTASFSAAKKTNDRKGFYKNGRLIKALKIEHLNRRESSKSPLTPPFDETQDRLPKRGTPPFSKGRSGGILKNMSVLL
jgi:hypothetical protein